MFLVQSGIMPTRQHTILPPQTAWLHPIKCALTQNGKRTYFWSLREWRERSDYIDWTYCTIYAWACQGVAWRPNKVMLCFGTCGNCQFYCEHSKTRFWPWSVSLFWDSIRNYWLSGYFLFLFSFVWCTSSNDAHSHLYWQQTQVWCAHPFHIRGIYTKLCNHNSPLISSLVTITGPNYYFHHVRYCTVELFCDISLCVWICFCVGISILWRDHHHYHLLLLRPTGLSHLVRLQFCSPW